MRDMKIITKKSEQKRIKEECWSLDFYLIKWLEEHLKVFKEDASKIVDLEYHKFKYKGKEYTQLELINKLLETINFLLSDEPYGSGNYTKLISAKDVRRINARKNEMYDLLKLLHWQLWW